MSGEFVAWEAVVREPMNSAWMRWMEHHSVDPYLVAIPGWMRTEPEERRIYWLTHRRDENRRLVSEEPYYETTYVQLEAEPSRFPQETAGECSVLTGGKE